MASVVLAETPRGAGGAPGCNADTVQPPGSPEGGEAARDAASLEGELRPQTPHGVTFRLHVNRQTEPPPAPGHPGSRAPQHPAPSSSEVSPRAPVWPQRTHDPLPPETDVRGAPRPPIL